MEIALIKGLIVVAILVPLAQSTTWDKCKSGPELPVKSFWIDACPGKIDQSGHECQIKIGHKLEVKIEFGILKNATVLKPKIDATKVQISLTKKDISNLDVCESLTKGHCPLIKGEIVSAQFWLDTDQIDVPSWWPRPEIDVELSVHNENNENLGCLSVPVLIRNWW